MEWLDPTFFTALLSIILIDLVLAGDNAIVIGLAARNLPKENQKKAIVWGTVGAIAIRASATLVVVWLLKLPALLLIGGLILIWIAYKLLVDKKDHDNIQAKNRLWPAIQTIIVADAVMGFDNVVAVAGASHGSFLLVIVGLLISVPIMVWGSTLFIRWMEKFPWIMYIGAGVLALTAGKMLTEDPLVHGWFAANPVVKWILVLLVVAGVLAAGLWRKLFGSLVSINDKGQLTIPQELVEEANIRIDDSFQAQRDEKGRLVLVKSGG
ncbi:Integral membrane protein TerC family protein [Paenibacillus konkukensis]|uniref:Integral membrane protein TerC family protein n=1 Tax=Paenibacillus konkukensis TaxID=2020716 RepID=A0ABY4RKZ4_9BACL|nr:YjbE family putative metal transport protein [Paenibacillus konkukensis]UQZ82845.1 Integral membrane protein TerC family protein [Paenibacillus konkukensis]